MTEETDHMTSWHARLKLRKSIETVYYIRINIFICVAKTMENEFIHLI